MKTLRIYVPLKEGIILERSEGGIPVTNVPHLVTHHSPAGFEWGYGGSGPADLALNILQAILVLREYSGEIVPCWRGECYAAAWKLHQDFKRQFIESAPHDGAVIPYAAVDAWLDEHLTPKLPPQTVRIANLGVGEGLADFDPALDEQADDHAARQLGRPKSGDYDTPAEDENSDLDRPDPADFTFR